MGAEDYLTKPFNFVILRARIGACLEKKRLRDKEALYLQEIEKEKKRADDLLHVILPDEVAHELKTTHHVKPRRHENVAVMFCDIVGFTKYCDQRQPEEVIPALQSLFETFETIASRHEVQKIKTIGDSFMAVAGLLQSVKNPVLNCVQCALEMIKVAQESEALWHMRAGIHVGPVVAGVVGHRQFLFDIWGDTVNIASRIEVSGIPDTIDLSRTAWDKIAEQSIGESLGNVPIKGKGEIEIVRFNSFVKGSNIT